MADEIVAVYRAEVEQYKKAVDELTGKVEELTAAEKKAGETGEKAMKGVAEVASDVSPEFSRASKAVTAFRAAIGKIVVAMKTLKTAIAATGIGLLVIAIGSVAAAVTRMQGPMDKMRVAFAGIGTAVGVVTDRLADFGSGLIDIFTGNAAQGIDKMRAAFTGMGQQISEASAAARVLEQRMIDLEKSKVVLSAATTKLDAEITKLNATFGDETISIERQLAAQQEILRLREKKSNVIAENIRQEIAARLVQEEANEATDKFIELMRSEELLHMSIAERAQFADEQLKKIGLTYSTIEGDLEPVVELINQYTAAEQEKFDGVFRGNQRINALQQKIHAEEAERVKEQQNFAKLLREDIEDRIDALQHFFDVQKQIYSREKAIEDERQKAVRDRVQRELDAFDELQRVRIEMMQEGADKEIAIVRQTLRDRKAAIIGDSIEEIELRKALEEKAQQDIAEIRARYDEQDRQRRRDNLEQQAMEFMEYTQVVADIYNTLSMAIMAGYDNELTALQNSLEAGEISQEQFDQKRREVARRRAADEKAAALFGAIISTAQAVASALVPFGPQSAFLAALAAGLGAVQIGIIASQPLPAFAKGVIGLQGAGTETSDSIPAMLSRGESVMTAAETRKHRDILEGIRKGSLDRIIHEQYVRPAVDSALLNGFADMGKSAALNGLGGFNDMNILRALDRHGFAEVGELRQMNVLLKRHLKAPKRGYA